ncbi:MAG: hypothetical protein ACYCTY_14895 [Sulfuricella sp.]
MDYNGPVAAGKPMRFRMLSMLRGKISYLFVNKAAKTPNQAMNAEDFQAKTSSPGREAINRLEASSPEGMKWNPGIPRFRHASSRLRCLLTRPTRQSKNRVSRLTRLTVFPLRTIVLIQAPSLRIAVSI